MATAKKATKKPAAKKPAAKKSAAKKPAAKKAAAKKAPAKKPAAKKAAKKPAAKRKPNAAFMKAMMPSAVLATVIGAHAARLQRRFDIFEHGKPGEEREALEDDGDVGIRARYRRVVPVDLSGGGLREPGEHTEQRGFAGA